MGGIGLLAARRIPVKTRLDTTSILVPLLLLWISKARVVDICQQAISAHCVSRPGHNHIRVCTGTTNSYKHIVSGTIIILQYSTTTVYTWYILTHLLCFLLCFYGFIWL